jgi:sn-glycerol 3-phosphate transport system ATP-binding protein
LAFIQFASVLLSTLFHSPESRADSNLKYEQGALMTLSNSIELKDVSKNFGKTEVVKHLNLSIKKGERMILLGPSGCGKSTILRMISGLETFSSGELYLNGTLANNVESGDRNIAMVFQNYALFPHLTVFDNIAYGLKINKIPKDETEKRVKEAISILELDCLEKRYPRELSGGQCQRVALARALVKRADFLLLDEPLSNLDAKLRGQSRKELVKIHEIYRQTFVYVTHDQIEAMTIGQRIALLSQGKLQMIDTPYNVYHHPTNIFVATFIGSPAMNILDVKRDNNSIIIGSQKITLTEEWLRILDKAGNKPLKMGIRPEDIILQKSGKETSENLSVLIQYIEDYGNRVGFYFDIEGIEVIAILPDNKFDQNEQCLWNLRPEKLHFFDAETGDSLGYPERI